MKKIINNPEDVVKEMLTGLEAQRPDLLTINYEKRIVVRKDVNSDNKVGILTGSGSGHEPDQVFYVGKGMLDAACAGPVFAAPTMDAIYDATKLIDSGKGVLYLVKNYTGDRTNFAMASEMSNEDGKKVETVIIDDDIAVKDSTFTAGRRGVAGAIFVYKIIGAKSLEDTTLEELKKLAEEVNTNVKSFGFALTSCTTPAKGSPTFDLGEDEMELGVGLHGEPGRERTKLKNANEVIKTSVNLILEHLPLKSNDEVAVMINGLGGTPIMELYLAMGIVSKILKEMGVKIFKAYVNEYCTSLDMAGCSVSILKVNEEYKRLLNYKVDIPYSVF